MTYSEKLKDPRWQKRRLEVLAANDWMCDRCGSKDNTLHVHHNFYRSKTEPWDYPDYALRVVCESCHELLERDRQQLKECIESIYECGDPDTNIQAAIGLLKGLRQKQKAILDRDYVEKLQCHAQRWGFARIFGGDERDLEVLADGTVALGAAESLWTYQLNRYEFRLHREQLQKEHSRLQEAAA